MLNLLGTEEQAAQNGNRLKHSVEAGRFQCLECSQTFGRVEHLTRHSRSHMKEHFLKCSHCRKGFYRMSVITPVSFTGATSIFILSLQARLHLQFSRRGDSPYCGSYLEPWSFEGRCQLHLDFQDLLAFSLTPLAVSLWTCIAVPCSRDNSR